MPHPYHTHATPILPPRAAQIAKATVEKDRLDKFLAKMDNPDYGRTIIDPVTKQEIVLTEEDVDMIKRIQGGEFPSGASDPYEDYIDFFTYQKQVGGRVVL